VNPKEVSSLKIPNMMAQTFPEIASVLVRLDQGAGVIVNANHGPRRRLVPGFML
jgi:hypothetical protein